jgi:protein CsiD
MFGEISKLASTLGGKIMNIVQEKPVLSFVQKSANYEIKPHPHHKRLYHIELSNGAIQQYLSTFADVRPQGLEYVPYMRYILSGKLVEIFGASFAEAVRGILNDRNSGGFTVGVQGLTEDAEDYVKFSTAFAHLVGGVNFDAMSGTYYARFTVKDTDSSDSYLRQAYRTFTMHTDGTFVDEPTDWLLMMKMDERNAIGGESRLLHLDDWEELEKFTNHPLATYKFTYKAPSSKNSDKIIHRTTFFDKNNAPCICFIDQFAYPETIEQANYLKDLSSSMENSAAVHALELPVGNLVMLNNNFWLHGRAAFEKHPDLHRELLRQRGYFAKV